MKRLPLDSYYLSEHSTQAGPKGATGATGPAGPKGTTRVAGPRGPAGGGLASVSYDSTLTRSGTSGSPLAVASSLSLAGGVSSKGVTSSNYTANGAAVEGNDYSNSGVGAEGVSYNEGAGHAGYGM